MSIGFACRCCESMLVACKGCLECAGPKWEHGFPFLAGRTFGEGNDWGKGVGEKAENNVILKGKIKGTEVCPEKGKITVGMSNEICWGTGAAAERPAVCCHRPHCNITYNI